MAMSKDCFRRSPGGNDSSNESGQHISSMPQYSGTGVSTLENPNSPIIVFKVFPDFIPALSTRVWS